MSTTSLVAPIPADPARAAWRPGLGRLAAVELRKALDTRAGLWLQVLTLVLTVGVVVVRLATGNAADHTFAEVLTAGLKPAAVLLPITGVLLITSEWSQRTGMITFALVPARSRVVVAKLLAGLVLGAAVFTAAVAVAVAAVAAAGPEGAWADAPTLVGQSAIFILAGMVIASAFGMVVLATTPALVALFALPSAWLGITSLPVFGDSGPWVDTGRALGELSQGVLDATQWAQVGTSLVLWMLVPLAIGSWRIARRAVAS